MSKAGGEFLGRMEGWGITGFVIQGICRGGHTWAHSSGRAKPCEQAAHGYFKVPGVQRLRAARAFQFSVSDAILSKDLIQRHNLQPEIHSGIFTAFISGFPFLWRLVWTEISSSSNSLGALCDCLPAFLMGKNSCNASLDNFVHSACVLQCLKPFNR